MKYDLIVCGGGPGGLTAAWTAAQDGLRVALVERKRDVAEVNRLCGQFANINMISVGGKEKYGYSEPLHLEIGTEKTLVHWPAIGCSIEYKGPLRPYLNYIHFSPCGHRVYREKDRFIAFFWEKESLLAGLLDSALKAGVEVLTETVALGAENTSEGVSITVRGRSGERTLQARKVIDALGHGSTIAESVGMGQEIVGSWGRSGSYVLEGVETEYRLNSWLCFTIPEIGRSNFWMFMVTGDRNVLGGGGGKENVDKFMKLPFYEPWFRRARIVKTLGVSRALTRMIPHLEPIKGNVLILGEAAGTPETSNPGAIACGFKAAKATVKELNGEKAYDEYTTWWQRAFEGNSPTYRRAVARFGVLNELCTNEEVDFLYSLIGDQVGVPAILVGKNPERIKGKRPELYAKLQKAGIDGPLEQFGFRGSAKSEYAKL